MADVGAEHRLERQSQRRQAAVERDRDHAVLGLAAEIERIDEERLQILDLAQGAGGELVEQRRALDLEAAVRVGADALGPQMLVAEFAEQALQQVDDRSGPG